MRARDSCLRPPLIPFTVASFLLGLGLIACSLFAWCVGRFGYGYVAKESAWIFAICEGMCPSDELEHRVINSAVTFDEPRGTYRVDFYVIRNPSGAAPAPPSFGLLESAGTFLASVWPKGPTGGRRDDLIGVEVKFDGTIKCGSIPPPSIAACSPAPSQDQIKSGGGRP